MRYLKTFRSFQEEPTSRLGIFASLGILWYVFDRGVLISLYLPVSTFKLNSSALLHHSMPSFLFAANLLCLGMTLKLTRLQAILMAVLLNLVWEVAQHIYPILGVADGMDIGAGVAGAIFASIGLLDSSNPAHTKSGQLKNTLRASTALLTASAFSGLASSYGMVPPPVTAECAKYSQDYDEWSQKKGKISPIDSSTQKAMISTLITDPILKGTEKYVATLRRTGDFFVSDRTGAASQQPKWHQRIQNATDFSIEKDDVYIKTLDGITKLTLLSDGKIKVEAIPYQQCFNSLGVPCGGVIAPPPERPLGCVGSSVQIKQ